MKRVLSLVLVVLCVFPVLALPLSAAESGLVEIENISNVHESSPYDDLRKFAYTPAPEMDEDGTPIEGETTKHELLTQSDVEKHFADLYKDAEGVQLITIYENAFRNVNNGIAATSEFFDRYYADYNIYFYFYLPEGVNIDTERGPGSVRMRYLYDKTVNGQSLSDADSDAWVPLPDEHEHSYRDYPIEIIGGYEDGQRIVKCRFVDPEDYWYDQLYNNGSWDHRRHDVVQVHFELDGSSNGQAYKLATSFTCSGFREGYRGTCECGGDTEYPCSACLPFLMTSSSIDVLQLDVTQTVYRTNRNTTGNQLNSVYFAVPERYFNTYGAIHAIKAGWQEAVTTPQIVTCDEALWNEYIESDLGPVLFKDISKWTDTPARALLALTLAVGSVGPDVYPVYQYTVDWAYNLKRVPTNIIGGGLSNTEYLNVLAWLFDSKTDGVWDSAPREVSPSEILTYYHDKIKENPAYKQYLVSIVNNWHEDVLYAEDTVEMSKYNTNSTIRDWWFNKDNIYNEVVNNVIQVLDSSAISELGNMSNTMISDAYFIDVDDVDQFKTACLAADANDERVVVLHFAQSEYYTRDLAISLDTYSIPELFTGKTYMMTQSMFLDFTIIETHFKNREGVITIVPVSSTPEDIVGPATPPPDSEDNIFGGFGELPWLGGGSDKDNGGGCLKGFEDFDEEDLKSLIFIVVTCVGGLIIIWGVFKIVSARAGKSTTNVYTGQPQQDKPKRAKKKRPRKKRSKPRYNNRGNYKRDRGGYKGNSRYNGRR